MDERTCERCKWWERLGPYGPAYCYSKEASEAMGHRKVGMQRTKAHFGCRFWRGKDDDNA